MKSYIKIIGPPTVKAIHALEKIAIESPETLIDSYYSSIIPSPSMAGYEDAIDAYLSTVDSWYRGTEYATEMPLKRRTKLISKSGHTLGEYDFFFEWARDPAWEELEDLMEKIDEAFAALGCRYTMATK